MKERFQELREQYEEFIYESYKVEENNDHYKITYTFKIKELVFNPVITILKKDITNQDIDKEYLDYLFFQYGLFERILYLLVLEHHFLIYIRLLLLPHPI